MFYMNIYFSVIWFMLFSSINKVNKFSIFVKLKNSSINTVLIFTFVSILVVLILTYIPRGIQFLKACWRAKWYLSERNITNTQQRACSYIIVKDRTMLLNILLETNRFFLIFMYWTSYFSVNDNAFYSIWKHIVFSFAVIYILQHFEYFNLNKTWSIIQKNFWI